MALSAQDLVDIRFFLKKGMRGDDNLFSSGELYARMYDPWLEDRLKHLTAAEEQRLLLILNDIRDMDEEITNARQLINIDTAGAFKRNKNEFQQRIALYNRRCNQLARHLNTTVGNYNQGGTL